VEGNLYAADSLNSRRFEVGRMAGGFRFGLVDGWVKRGMCCCGRGVAHASNRIIHATPTAMIGRFDMQGIWESTLPRRKVAYTVLPWEW
jgi:hypothetical protein